MVSILLGEQRYFEETLPISELKELLDAGSMDTAKGQAERIRGLKWLLAMISKGTDVSRFFPDVIRNIMTPNLELKKLVYMYVLHYADHDETSRAAALLSINAFQRDLSDDHELIRGLALRTLTSIRVDDVQAVQALAVRTCARDASPYVRKIAANAVTKICLQMSRANPMREQFEDEVLGKLLLDSAPSVMGSAAAAMLHVCPDRYDLVNVAFDRLLNVLTEIDEWGQIAVLELFTRYARYTFTNPIIAGIGFGDENEDGAYEGVSNSLVVPASSKRRQQQLGEDASDDDSTSAKPVRKWQGVVLAPVVVASSSNKRRLPTKSELETFLDDDREPSYPQEPEKAEVLRKQASPQPDRQQNQSFSYQSSRLPMHENHKRLLRAALPLLKSRNSGVVVAAASTMWYCGQRSKNAMQRVAQALIRLVRSPYSEVRYCALRSVLPLIHERPGPFTANLPDFFVNPSLDAPFVRRLKLEIMCHLVREKTLANVLRELETYVTHPNENFAAQAVRTVGSIAIQHKRSVARDCLIGLAGFITSESSSKRVLEESIVVSREVLTKLKATLQDDELSVLQTFLRGFDRLPSTLVRARCSLLWLSREFYARGIKDEAGDILRSIASTFIEEAVETKLQALSLASVCAGDEPLLSSYVFDLGAFDPHFHVRDWARCLSQSQCPMSVSEPAENSITILDNGESNQQNVKHVDELDSISASAKDDMAGKMFEEPDDEDDSCFRMDSLSFVVKRAVPGYSALPEWAIENRLKTYSSKQSSAKITKSNGAPASSESSSEETDSSSGETGTSEDSSDDENEGEEEMALMATEPKAKTSLHVSSQKDIVALKSGGGQPASERENLAERQGPNLVRQQARESTEKTAPPKSIADPSIFPVVAAASPSVKFVRPVEFKPLVSQVRGQGLQIEHWFSREFIETDQFKLFTPVRLKFANKLDDRTLSKIRIEENDSVSPLSEPVESLAPGFYRDDIRIMVAFKGHWRTPVKFTVGVEEIGKIMVELRAPAGELLIPDSSLSLDEFTKLKKHLVGMNETSAKIANPNGFDVQKRVLECCNFFPFTSSGESANGGTLLSDTLTLRFSAKRMDSSMTRVLLQINIGLDGLLDVSLHCEYALAGGALMDEIKSALA